MQLKIKGDGAFEVDMCMSNRSDVAHVALGPVPFRVLGCLVVLMRVPYNDDVCQQRQSTGDCGHLLAGSPPPWRDRSVVDGPLERMHGLDLRQQTLDFLSESRPPKVSPAF